MSTHNKDFTYCQIEDKIDELCVSCKRNIDIWDVTPTTWLGDFHIRTVKNLKSGTITYKCDGYLKKDKRN